MMILHFCAQVVFKEYQNVSNGGTAGGQRVFVCLTEGDIKQFLLHTKT